MLTLRGEIVDSVKKEIIKVGQPIVSDDAIAWIVGRILPYTSKMFALSYLDDVAISNMIYEFGEDISAELMFPEEIGIDRKNRDFVKGLMIHTFVATANKARNGQTLKKLLEQHTVMEQITANQQQQSKKGKLIPSIFKGDKTQIGGYE